MRRIGLTGGIGTGKTYIANIFESLGVPIFNADIESKKLISTSNSLINDIIQEFGDNIYVKGQLDKKKLSQIVFTDIKKLERLNNLVHPKISKIFANWCNKQTTKYIIKEAAILFESGSHLELDKIICVSAPLDLRIKRIINRDNSNVKSIKNRIKNQMEQEKKELLSDYIIINDEKEKLLSQIIAIHENLLS